MLSAETAFPGFADWYKMGQSKLMLNSKGLSLRGGVPQLSGRMSKLSADEQSLNSKLPMVNGECFDLTSTEILCNSIPLRLKTA